MRVTRDLDLAEECVQDAYARALTNWAEAGIPSRPAAWLTTTARNRALDLIRRDALFRRAMPELVMDDVAPPAEPDDGDEIADDRLRLICTCCHPALAQEAQIALTLRLLCGLSTADVARAFLVSEPTMAARITRAKKKIAAARIPYRVPAASELPERIAAVAEVVHLLFTTGHTAPAGATLVRRDLVERATDLARMLHALLPDSADVSGLLALVLLTDARRATRSIRTVSSSCSRIKTAASGTPARSPRASAGPRRAAASSAEPVCAAGRHRRGPRRGAELGRDRLARGGRAVRRAR